MATQAERRARTREKLVEAARAEFVESGYEDAQTASILARSGLSRGALYHHFDSKKALFEAVFVAESEHAIASSTRHSRRGESPLENLIRACLSWLQALHEPDVAALLIDQGPRVLGWERARDLETETSLEVMRRGVQKAVDAGEIEISSVDLTARLINALLGELVLVAVYSDPPVSQAMQEAAFRQMIGGLVVRR